MWLTWQQCAVQESENLILATSCNNHLFSIRFSITTSGHVQKLACKNTTLILSRAAWHSTPLSWDYSETSWAPQAVLGTWVNQDNLFIVPWSSMLACRIDLIVEESNEARNIVRAASQQKSSCCIRFNRMSRFKMKEYRSTVWTLFSVYSSIQ